MVGYAESYGLPDDVTIPHTTLHKIHTARERGQDNYKGVGIPMSGADFKCPRAAYYSLRWAKLKDHSAQTLRVFERGNLEEARVIAELLSIGVTVSREQERVRLADGWLRGKIDGVVEGLPESPQPHVLEIKTASQKNFNPISKKGVQLARPDHYKQCQLYMKGLGLEWALYVCVNKNTEQLYMERVAFDSSTVDETIKEAVDIVSRETPPPKAGKSEKFYLCSFCDHVDICHNKERVDVSCRTCMFWTPTQDGLAVCGRSKEELSIEDQVSGCSKYLTNPDMVDAMQIDYDPDFEWIEYKTREGDVFRDTVGE